ncbi:uncharacterized protein V3H82_013179 [Fundulus diaphanus]
MAAVTSVRNGGASGTRTSKGLFLVVTLLSLVCYTSALLDKGTLAEMKENHQRTKENLEKLKNRIQSDPYSGLMSEYIHILDPMIALVKKHAGDSSDLLDPLVPLLKKTKDVLEKTKTFVDDKKKGFDVDLEELEEKIKQNEKIINFLEEQQAEL